MLGKTKIMRFNTPICLNMRETSTVYWWHSVSWLDTYLFLFFVFAESRDWWRTCSWFILQIKRGKTFHKWSNVDTSKRFPILDGNTGNTLDADNIYDNILSIVCLRCWVSIFHCLTPQWQEYYCPFKCVMCFSHLFCTKSWYWRWVAIILLEKQIIREMRNGDDLFIENVNVL